MMPLLTSPWSSSRCWTRAMKPRKMLPAPKWTQMGFCSVSARMGFQSNLGKATPACSQAATS